MNSSELKKGAFLSYVILFLNGIIGLIYTPYLLFKLGQNEFGLFSLVSSIVAYLTIFDFGFGNAIIRYTAKFRAEKKINEQYSMFGLFFTIYSIIGVIVLVLGIIFYINIDYFFKNTMDNEEIEKAGILILIMIFNLSITFPFSIFGSIISGYEKYVFQKIIQIIRIILNTFLMIVLLEYGYKSIPLVICISFFNIFSLFVNWWYCIYKLNIKFHFKNFKLAFFKEISLYSFYIFLNVIMDKVYWGSGQFILASLIGTSAVAIFALAIQLQQMYMSFSTAITGVFLPKVTTLVTIENSEKQISDLFIKTGRIQFIVMSFILTGFILFGKQFIYLWAGESYGDVYTISLIFFIPLTVPLIQNMGITILQARNQMKFRSVLYIIIALLSLFFQIPLAKKYGSIGVAIAISFALTVGQILIMNIYYYKKQNIDIPSFWKEIGKMSIIPALIGIGTYYLFNHFDIVSVLDFIIAIFVFTFIYYSCFWFFSMNKYEKELLKKPLYTLFFKK